MAQLTYLINLSELGTLECYILNPDLLINLEINNRRKALFNLEIKKKSGSSINPDIHCSKVSRINYISAVAHVVF